MSYLFLVLSFFLFSFFSVASMDRKQKGRRKIKMQKIERKDYLQVAFSKRKQGIFKKAGELCTLCGSGVAIIIFSPAGKAFSFGNPSVNFVVDKFLHLSGPQTDDLQQENHDQNAYIEDLYEECSELSALVEAEKEKGKMLAERMRNMQKEFRWAGPLEKLDLNELEMLRVSMEKLKIRMLQPFVELMEDPVSEKAPMSANQMNHPRHHLLTQGPRGDQIQNLDYSHMVHNSDAYPYEQKPNIAPPMGQNVATVVQNINKPYRMEQNLNMLPMGSYAQ